MIESIIGERQSEDRLLTLQALFLGAAGLLPSQCEGKIKFGNTSEIPQLEHTWQSLKVETNMSYADWHFFRMHPKNFPSSRLLAAASLFDQYLDNGLLEGVMNLARKASPGKGSTSIEKGIIIPDLLGQGRAREIAVNVILPFSLAWAQTNTQQRLKQHILKLYQKYPKSGENQVIRYLEKLFWYDGKSKIINSAQRQQGMVHLYKTFCQEQRCRDCPIVSASP